LVKVAKANKAITSDELAEHLSLSRGTVVHHLNKLMEAGIVVHKGNHYTLRAANLTYLIEETEQDILRMLNELKRVAQRIDDQL
jgi:predicted transcriptional regulator